MAATLNHSTTLKFAIDRHSRSLVDTAIERVRGSVVPIIGESRGRPHVIGSATCVRFSGLHFIITALHVMEDEPLGRGYFAADGLSRSLVGQFQISEKDDLAVKRLSPSEVLSLRHVHFLAEEDFVDASELNSRFYATVVGYPATAARRLDKVTLATPPEAASHFARCDSEDKVVVAFDKKLGAFGRNGHVVPKDPYGKSGGAIFAMPASGRVILPFATAKLAGIATRWIRRDRTIVGAGIGPVRQLLASA